MARTYDSVLSGMLDKTLPITTVHGGMDRLVPWLDSDCVAAMRLMQHSEHRFNANPALRRQWRRQTHKLKKLYRAKAPNH